MRLLSAVAQEHLAATHPGDGPLTLITVSHPTMALPQRYCADVQPWTSRGHPYVPYPFDVGWPDDVEGQQPTLQVFFAIVWEETVKWLRGLPDPKPILLVEVARFGDPDDVFLRLPAYELTSSDHNDPATIVANLGLREIAVQRCFRTTYGSDNYAALARVRR